MSFGHTVGSNARTQASRNRRTQDTNDIGVNSEANKLTSNSTRGQRTLNNNKSSLNQRSNNSSNTHFPSSSAGAKSSSFNSPTKASKISSPVGARIVTLSDLNKVNNNNNNKPTQQSQANNSFGRSINGSSTQDKFPNSSPSSTRGKPFLNGGRPVGHPVGLNSTRARTFPSTNSSPSYRRTDRDRDRTNIKPHTLAPIRVGHRTSANKSSMYEPTHGGRVGKPPPVSSSHRNTSRTGPSSSSQGVDGTGAGADPNRPQPGEQAYNP